MEETETKTAPPWAGFWRRVIAFFLDGLVLAMAGLLIGWLANAQVSVLGSNGRLVGLAVQTLYFTLFTSALAKGRTLGKQALGLRVVRRDGKPLGLGGALVRSLVLNVPLFLNGYSAPITDPVLGAAFSAFAIFVVFGVSLAQIYLLLFNSPSRRLLHDMVVGSMVIRADRKPAPAPLGGVHRVIVSLILLAFLTLGVVPQFVDLTRYVDLSGLKAMNAEMNPAMAAVDALPEVAECGVNDNTTTGFGDGAQSVRTLIVTARLKTPIPSDSAAADREAERVAHAVIGAYRFAPGQKLSIVLTYGYDLGIARASHSYGASVDPATGKVTR